MAKQSKAKVKTAKKTAKPTSAKKTAKAKKAKTVKRARPRLDPCAPLRAARERILKRIEVIEERLSDGDVPAPEKRRLEAELKQKQNQASFNKQRLDDCERQHPPPRT